MPKHEADSELLSRSPKSEVSVLLVDDRPANLFALEHTLSELGAKLVKASSGQEALVATLHEDFALAILDVQMPGMDGYELAELMRGNPDTMNLPIIFLTADSAEEWQVFKGYESGAVDYIVKPYQPAVLRSKVRVFLQMYAQQRALRRSQDELANVNKELEAFAYSVSHDLRAPLRAIEGFSQALLEDYLALLDPMGQDFLQRISNEACRMAQLIDDLLQLSRVSRVEMNWEEVELSALAQELLERLAEQEPERQVEWSIAPQMVAQGDYPLLRQMMENLLSNAWKFSRPQSPARIAFELSKVDGRDAYVLRDNGVGFDMKYASKLFAPFQRLHAMSEFPGTGVGLCTVQRIVARHHGRIWCQSELGVGTSFYWVLNQGMEGDR
ncbi:MAG: response regulator [Myxococcota bacterium]|jgi:signal transduction histidine kinase|nr:response regulator [Myxococcota bacterium]